MKTTIVTSLAFTSLALLKGKKAKVEARPRSARMDKLMSQVNGSPRFDVANVAVQVSQALARSKKTA
jgi:hypothetical protein